jgi:hypothetical protein
VGAVIVIIILLGATFGLSITAAELAKDSKPDPSGVQKMSDGTPIAMGSAKASHNLVDFASLTAAQLKSVDEVAFMHKGDWHRYKIQSMMRGASAVTLGVGIGSKLVIKKDKTVYLDGVAVDLSEGRRLLEVSRRLKETRPKRQLSGSGGGGSGGGDTGGDMSMDMSTGGGEGSGEGSGDYYAYYGFSQCPYASGSGHRRLKLSENPRFGKKNQRRLKKRSLKKRMLSGSGSGGGSGSGPPPSGGGSGGGSADMGPPPSGSGSGKGSHDDHDHDDHDDFDDFDYFYAGSGSGSGSGMGSGGDGGYVPTCDDVIAMVDMDGNGKVPLVEWKALGNCHTEEEFNEWDGMGDGNGKLEAADCEIIVETYGKEVLKILGDEAANPKCGGDAAAEI